MPFAALRDTSLRTFRRLSLLGLLATGFVVFPADAEAQTRRGPRTAPAQQSGVRDVRSRNFLVHTDLSPEKSQELLDRLETMLGIISKYWGQPNRQPIECYVVDNLANWPNGVFPPEGLLKIQRREGVTMTTVRLINGRPIQAKSIVYSIADDGVPQHEAVHAYCGQNFGHTGPLWYAEGMAEMGNYWRKDDPSVNLPEVVLQYLQESEPRKMLEIVDNTDQQSGDSWQNYAWRWALCHLLANNPNYAARFRPLGLNFLLDKPDSFEQTYGNMAKEIGFEYGFFLEHLDNGLRSDLIAWDWKATYKTLSGSRSVAALVEANRGWQPSRLRVETGVKYKAAATGNWQLTADGPELTAAGIENGGGQLMGVVQDPDTYRLSEPFPIPLDTPFEAPTAGNLLLRCQDEWTGLADNTGKINIRLTLAEE